ncbi:MAG: YbbR domain-containing protein [Myxococcota bacterium]
MAESLFEQITRNPGYKLLSLAVAVAAWVYVQGGEEQEARIRARLVWELPEGLVPVEPPTQEVTLEVRGTRAATRRAHDRDLTIALDATALPTGTHEILVEGLQVEGLGTSVELLGVSPETIQLELDEIARRNVAILAVQVGEPAPGYAVSGIAIEPAVVPITGPRVTVERLREISTAPIDISGLRTDASIAVALELPRGVELYGDIEPILRASVSVAPNLEREVIANVPVQVWQEAGWYTAVQTVAVTLEGPASELRSLAPEEVVAFVHLPEAPDRDRYEAPYGPSEGLRLRILHARSDDVTVVRVEPSSVEVLR